MVKEADVEYLYFTAGDEELDRLLRGEGVAELSPGDFLASGSLEPGKAGVLVASGRSSDEPSRPLAVVCQDEDVQWLCGRYAHVRSDFSPLTAWCHLLGPEFRENVEGLVHGARLAGTVAAWSGLVVAETLLLSGRPIGGIRISGCFASATYAVGRARALWDHLSLETVLGRFDLANSLCRGTGAVSRDQVRASQVRSAFMPMWGCLVALGPSRKMVRKELRSLVMALEALRDARERGDANEASRLARPLLDVMPEAEAFDRLREMRPEARLKLFDQLVAGLKETGLDEFDRRNALALAGGYLATVAAGGAASLALVEDYADEFPELSGWAYLTGGIGERVTWTSAFDGLGRLIAREMCRPFRLDEAPTCDFAFDEAVVLSDKELKEPLVHLRVKQARVLNVSIFPGVNIAIPIVDAVALESTHRRVEEREAVSVGQRLEGVNDRLLAVVAEALWPHLRSFVIDETTERFAAKRRRRGGSQGAGRKQKPQETSELPLDGRGRGR